MKIRFKETKKTESTELPKIEMVNSYVMLQALCNYRDMLVMRGENRTDFEDQCLDDVRAQIELSWIVH